MRGGSITAVAESQSSHENPDPDTVILPDPDTAIPPDPDAAVLSCPVHCSQVSELYATGAGGDTFRRRIEITHPTLRLCMGLKRGEEMHHDVQASQSRDPVTLEKVFTISQVSVMSSESVRSTDGRGCCHDSLSTAFARLLCVA